MTTPEAPPKPAAAPKASPAAKPAAAAASASAAKPAAAAPAARPRSRAKRVLWMIGIFLVSVGAAYGAGYLQMRARLDGLEREVAEARRTAETAEQARAVQQRLVNELEARRKIHLAINEFDQNNFGTAEDHLRAAADLLEAQPQGAAPAAPLEPGLTALVQSLRTLELAPTLDLVAQRTALLGLAAKFDNLRPTPAR